MRRGDEGRGRKRSRRKGRRGKLQAIMVRDNMCHRWVIYLFTRSVGRTHIAAPGDIRTLGQSSHPRQRLALALVLEW